MKIDNFCNSFPLYFIHFILITSPMAINITRHRKTWFIFSGILFAVSIAVSLIFPIRLGLDFTGGARWTIDFQEENVDRSRVTDFFKSLGTLTQEPQIQTTAEGYFLITIESMSDEEIQRISREMKEKIGEFEQISYRKVDSTIGKSFQRKAFSAIVVTLVAITLFIAMAFRKVPKAINPWRFGIVTIVALFHDVFVVFGTFVVLGYFLHHVEMDLPFLTALLATLGFSVNDTIVILDRVRENIHFQKMNQTLEDIVEKSIQETIFRSLATSVSTIIPLITLLFFGAESIFYFVLALAIGIVIGTYSSIFIAAPLLVTWKNWADSRE